mgnify:CR=1 FL=1
MNRALITKKSDLLQLNSVEKIVAKKGITSNDMSAHEIKIKRPVSFIELAVWF